MIIQHKDGYNHEVNNDYVTKDFSYEVINGFIIKDGQFLGNH